jgi:hypothetical protein
VYVVPAAPWPRDTRQPAMREVSYSNEDSNRSRRWQITASWEALSHSTNEPWRTPVDCARLATDQKVGGSSPSERAD